VAHTHRVVFATSPVISTPVLYVPR